MGRRNKKGQEKREVRRGEEGRVGGGYKLTTVSLTWRNGDGRLQITTPYLPLVKDHPTKEAPPPPPLCIRHMFGGGSGDSVPYGGMDTPSQSRCQYLVWKNDNKREFCTICEKVTKIK